MTIITKPKVKVIETDPARSENEPFQVTVVSCIVLGGEESETIMFFKHHEK